MLPESEYTALAPRMDASSSTFDTRMRRAVQQENRSLQASLTSSSSSASIMSSSSSSSSSKRKRPYRNGPIPCGKILIVLSPIAFVFGMMMVLRTYNAWSTSEREIASLLDSAEKDVQSAKQRVVAQQQQQQQHQQRRQQQDHTLVEILVLTTKHGAIRIQLRPDLSRESIEYLHTMLDSDTICHACNFYRAERPGILQGIMKNRNVAVNTVKGSCPDDGGISAKVPNDCPKWDAQCGCHGPVMTRGSVAWAAGDSGGPDFFIDNYPNPAKFWGTQHTNFGTIVDEESFRVINKIFDLPIKTRGGMSYLEETIHFDMGLELEDG
jgi:cyclophilin family peptidyl-prolyl cis-trans isomerase